MTMHVFAHVLEVELCWLQAGYTAFLAACIGGFVDTAQALYSPDSCNSAVDRVRASRQGFVASLNAVIPCCCRCCAQNGHSCLQHAVSRRRMEMAKWALANGCSPLAKDNVRRPTRFPC